MRSLKSRLVVALSLASAVALGGAGCGLLVTVTGPSTAQPGQQVSFDVTVTNPSQCPVGEVQALVIPFVSPADLIISGPPVFEEILRGLIEAACTGQPVNLPLGITCQIVDNRLVCTIETAEITPDAVGDAILKNEQGTVLSCHLENARMICQIPALAGASMPPPPATLSCSAFAGPAQLCQLAFLAPGQSASAQVSAFAPQSPGPYDTLVFAGASQTGICLGGANSGLPCGGNDDCPMSTCGSGICVNDTTQALGAGCNSGTDCAAGSSCVQCRPSDPVVVPLACAQITVIRSAPAVSHMGAGVAMTALLALGFFGLVGLRRRA